MLLFFSWNKFVTEKLCKHVNMISLFYFILFYYISFFSNCAAINWNSRLSKGKSYCKLRLFLNFKHVAWNGIVLPCHTAYRNEWDWTCDHFSYLPNFNFVSLAVSVHFAPIELWGIAYKKFDRIFILIQCFVIASNTRHMWNWIG